MQSGNKHSIIRRHYASYPDDWIITELGELLERVVKPVEVIPDHEYREIGIRSHGKGLFHKEPVTGSGLGNKSVFWVEVDCLIINIVFAWEQAVGITTTHEKGMIASHRFPMWQSKGNVELHYLLRFFLTPFGRHLLELASPGGAGRNKTLVQDEFNKTLVCIPSNIKEQQKIVKILSTWDNAIELKEQLIAEKKRQKQWLMQNLMTGRKRLPGFSGDWQRVRLGDMCKNVFGGGTPPRNIEHYYKGSIPWVTVKDLDGVQQKYDSIEHITIDAVQQSTSKIIQKGNLIVATRMGLGRGFINMVDMAINQDMKGIILDDKLVSTEFAYYSFIELGSNLERLGNGSTVKGIDLQTLLKMTFNLPPLPEQAAIAKILSTADREISLHEKQLDEIKKQKNALIQLLLAGIVRVNALEVS